MFNNINENKLTIIIAAMIQFTATFVGNMLTVSLNEISNNFNVPFETINFLSISFLIALISISIPLGKIITQRGVKKYTKISLVLLMTGMLISAFSPDINILIISRIIQGISTSILLITIYMLIVNQIEEEHVGHALGIVGSCGYIAMTSAPTISGFIVEHFSWRALFLIFVPICIIELGLLFLMKNEWKTAEQPIDISGSVLYALIMILSTVGILNLDEWGIFPLIISTVLFIIFILIEKNKDNPVYHLELLKNSKYFIGNYAAMVTYFITYIGTYIITIYLTVVLDLNLILSGIILLITPVIMVIISPYAGRLSDKYEPRLLSGIASAILLCVMVILFFIESLPMPLLILIMLLQGIGHGLFSPPNNKYVLTLVDKKDLSDATSFLTTSKEFGKNLSLGLYSLLVSIAFGSKSMDEDIHMFFACSRSTMILSVILTLSVTILLFYSRYQSSD